MDNFFSSPKALRGYLLGYAKYAQLLPGENDLGALLQPTGSDAEFDEAVLDEMGQSDNPLEATMNAMNNLETDSALYPPNPLEPPLG
jgi:hypothetical protein